MNIDEETRHRKPSAYVNSDGARGERAQALKRSRSGYIGQLTKYYKELQNLMRYSENYYDIDDILKIKEKISTTFASFEECHRECMKYLDKQNELEEITRVYSKELQAKRDMEQEIETWIANTKEKTLPTFGFPTIEPFDSVSQQGSHGSGGGSHCTKSTTASKLKLKAQAKQAVAQLKLKQLKEEQALQENIDETTMRMKLNESMKLNKMKRHQMLLKAQHEADQVKAELQIYEKADKIEQDESYEDQRVFYRYPFRDNELAASEPIFIKPEKQSTPQETTRAVNTRILTNPFVLRSNPELKNDVTMKMPWTPTAEEWLMTNTPESIRNPNRDDTRPGNANGSSNNELVFKQMLKQQEQIVKTMTNTLMLPKPELFTFDGNHLHYWMFIRNFERNIEGKTSDESEKLNYLLQYCTGKAKEVVRNCVVMEPSLGYVTARKLLQERFGEPYAIASAHIEQVSKGPPLRASDREGLLNFADKLKDCELTLRSIGYLDDLNSADNLRKIAERFPFHLRARWLDIARGIRNGGGKPRINQMAEFITEKAMAANDPVFGEIMDAKDPPKNERPRQRNKFFQNTPRATTLATQADTPRVPNAPRQANSNSTFNSNKPTAPNITCLLCDGAHPLVSCREFEKRTYSDRVKFVRTKGLCDNCYKRGHKARNCFQKGLCEIEHCEGKHNTLLHPPSSSDKKDSDKNHNTNNGSGDAAQCHVVKSDVNGLHKDTGAGKTRRVCLPIVPIRVRGRGGQKTINTYALLDKGSDTSLCEKRLIQQLGVDGEERTFSLTTIEGTNCQKRGLVTSLEVMPLNSDDVVEIPTVWSVDKLHISTEGVPRQEDIPKWPHLDGIKVPEIDSGEVTLLIGNDTPEVFWVLEERRGQRKQPYAVRSLLGWTVVGPMTEYTGRHCLNTHFINRENELNEQVEKFWKTDFGDPIFSTKESMSTEDKKALSIMEETIVLVKDHYQIALPWRYGKPCVTNNRQMAEKRLSSLKRRLLRDPLMHERYKDVINDHLKKGHARQVIEEPKEKDNPSVWYLPHHPVCNPQKPEKVRVVFDCAAKWQGTSLNDQLFQGPDLTNKLIGVLTRFREEPIAVAADVEGMFLQVRVDPKDCDMLRFLWWPEGELDKRPAEFQMLVHLFGATSSPSCANFALRRTADDNQSEFDSEVTNTVHRNFYVDDCLKSTCTVEGAKRIASELSKLLRQGGFRLTKWMSNKKEVLNAIPEAERAKNVKKLDFETFPTERALGVQWDVEEDRLGFKTQVKEKPLTRRGILSVMSSVYDPLGIVSPFMLPVKILLQDLCKRKLGWDDPIPTSEMTRWNRWLEDLPKLSNISIPRCVKPPEFGDVILRELHHFGDASQSGYGAVSYLRSKNSKGEVHVSFLIGKSRLAPVKITTIPRLELSAAVVAVKLDKMLREELELPIQESLFWTDSTTVLQYISNETKRFSTFVANRLAVIHDTSNAQQWRHVDSKSNPADDSSRGLNADQMISDARWLEGPAFLWQESSLWPSVPHALTQVSDDDPEVKRERQVRLVQGNSDDVINSMFNRYSSWHRLKIAIAWLLRYKRFLVNNYRQRSIETTSELINGAITTQELTTAKHEIIRYTQRQSFPTEMAALDANVNDETHTKARSQSTKRLVEKSSPTYKLNPQLRDGMLCVGGRLENAPIAESAKHPLILPKNHHIGDLIIRHYHCMYGHVGKEHVLSLIRQNFWIIRARASVRRLLDHCFECRRRNAQPCEQMMAGLPSDRLTPDKPPFSYVGVDFFGPLQVKRGRTIVKRYGCLFTCLVMRAVHIEIAHTLETSSFIDALHRFINRRGKPLLMRSDNGTNFKGGERELRESIQEWNQQAIHEFLRQREIRWIFNPPAASNMGGAWERMIRSVRQILRALLKEQIVDDETLLTVMSHVEAILNSHPLTNCSDDPKDDDPLTPNQILLLRSDTSLPPGVFRREDMYGRRRWRQAQYLADQFWKRWVREYLPLLQERVKWNKPRRNVAVGDIVLISDKNLPRGAWPLARVTKVYTAKDGYVRSAEVMTKTAVLTRPINKLCLLEAADANSVCEHKDFKY